MSAALHAFGLWAGLLAGFWTAWADPARAQAPLALRAGDQPQLSRLVLDLPPGTQWVMDQEGRQVVLRFPASALDFDTSAVFPERKASRVLSARVRSEATGTVMILTLACDCAAEAFTLGPRKLVLDLRDSPPADRLERRPPPPPRPRVAADPDPAPAAVATPAPEAVSDSDRPEPAPSPDPIASAPDIAGPATETPAPLPVDDPATPTEADIAEIETARLALLERLSRAAEEGLVELRDPEPAPGPAPDPEPDASPAMPTPPPPPDPGIDIRTAREAARRPDPGPPPPGCPADPALAVADWGTDAPAAAQIATVRAALVGEFDRVDAQALDSLVRLYIHLGFGHEAEALMRTMPGVVPEAALLTDLAHLVDGRPAPPRGPLLAAGEGCPGRAALWQFLARLGPVGAPAPADLALPDTDATQAALAELPAMLRRQVGPRLALGFLALGRADLAEAALIRIRRPGGEPGDDFFLAEAALLDALGRHEEAEAIWRALIARDRPNATQAMVALTESRIARDLAPPEGLSEDLAARAFERRRAEDGVRLRLAEVEARAAEGDLPMALALLRREMDDRPDREAELRAAAARTFARASSARTGPALYAAAVLAHRGLLAEGPAADPARLVLAAEMTGLGLPNSALDLLVPALARAAPAARMAAARAHLALSEAEAALPLLDGLESRDAAMMRAAAHALAGRHASALAALPADAPGDLRAAYAFAAGDWERASDSLADPVDRLLAAYMAGTDPAEIAPDATDPADRPDTAFLAPPRLEEPITLELARDTMEMARNARELLKSRLAPPGG